MGDPLSHFARIIASDFYNDLQPHSADTSSLVLELVSPQWINSTNDIHLLDSNPTQITLTHLQEESLRHFHRETRSLRVPTHYTSITRQILLALPLFLLQRRLRLYIIPFSEYSSDHFNATLIDQLPILQLQQFQPNTMYAVHRHPITQLLHQTTPTQMPLPRTTHFSYRLTTAYLKHQLSLPS